MSMIHQTETIIELQFLFYLIPVLIGIQLASYFFYQYYKIKNLNLQLNRILLSFGTFISCMITSAFFIQISRLYISNPSFNEIISKIGWIMGLSSPIGFLIFLNVEDFSLIINRKIMQILMALSLIPILLVIILPSVRNPIFLLSIVFTLLNAYYIFYFQIKLISRSFGKIKIKLKQFFLGEIISLTAVAFAIQVGLSIYPPGITEIIYFIGVSILIIGFIIIFYAVNEFPPFYEFEWNLNLSKLFVINPRDNICLYFYDFAKYDENSIQQKDLKAVRSNFYKQELDKFYSGGFIGIEDIISTITHTEKEKIRRIEQEDSIILLDYGTTTSNLIFILIVKKDMKSNQYFLEKIKEQFESFYREILRNLESIRFKQELLFGSFDIIIENIMRQ